MPIMLATFSTNKIIVLKRYVSERRKMKKRKEKTLTRHTHTHTHKQTARQRNDENTGLIN